MANRGKKIISVLLPVLVLAAGFGGMLFMGTLKSTPQPKVPEKRIPTVKTMVVEIQDHRFDVRTQGTVAPKTTLQLVPEVGGRVVHVSENLKDGAFFRKDEKLVEIDGFDYTQAVVAAKGDLASTKLALARAKAEESVAEAEYKELGSGSGDPLALHKLAVRQAAAAVEAAEARLELAQRNLERTKILAPFDGRVLESSLEVGQVVGAGTLLAQLYGTDYVEVNLPVPTRETAYLELPLGAKPTHFPKVTLSADLGQDLHWEGRIVRTQAQVDSRTHMLGAVAQVADPYGNARLPLTPGTYVSATIEGIQITGVSLLPRAALWEGDRVLVITPENTLTFREVGVVRKTEDMVVINQGLQHGERICLSRLEVVVDGMAVKFVEADRS